WIDHGAKPEAAAYEYAVVPGVEEEAFQTWISRKAVEVLHNTPELQAVRHKESGVLGAAFYKPGRLEASPSVAVDKPCLVLAVKQKGAVRIAVSNPENQPLQAEVLVELPLQGEGVAHPDGKSSRILFDLPAGTDAGKSVVKTFTIEN
ncbi:MAG: polysaccharide lyase beta-sandwich domain-containing protein, partial [Planctomycetota bacterium]